MLMITITNFVLIKIPMIHWIYTLESMQYILDTFPIIVIPCIFKQAFPIVWSKRTHLNLKRNELNSLLLRLHSTGIST